MTEIEIRGKIAMANFERLVKLLSSEGRLVDHYHRLSVDLSPGFDKKTRTWKNPSGFDIRVKKSDGKEKITIKIGGFQDRKRKEVEVELVTGRLLEALDLLEALGYPNGMIYYWESWEYSFWGVEIKLSKYTDDYFTFEIESKESLEVEKIAKELNLTPYSEKEYREVINRENQNIHQIYRRGTVEKMLEESF